MSAALSRVERWEQQLKHVFDEIDTEFENEGLGQVYSRHPRRPPAFSTGNREDDGLFDLGAAFSVGIGSEHGPGYVLQARIATLENVPKNVQEKFEREVVKRLKEKLPKAFPGVTLQVDRDGPVYKIHGDLSLGSL